VSQEITEGALRLIGADGWQLLKWDESTYFRQGIGKLCGELEGRAEGTKAVDVVALFAERQLYLIELKDFRGHRIENKERQIRELPLEIALKVRDTLAGLVGQVALGVEVLDASGAELRALLPVQVPVRVIACVAEDPARDARKSRVIASERLQRLKQRLSWLTHKVWLTGPEGVTSVAEGLRAEHVGRPPGSKGPSR